MSICFGLNVHVRFWTRVYGPRSSSSYHAALCLWLALPLTIWLSLFFSFLTSYTNHFYSLKLGRKLFIFFFTNSIRCFWLAGHFEALKVSIIFSSCFYYYRPDTWHYKKKSCEYYQVWICVQYMHSIVQQVTSLIVQLTQMFVHSKNYAQLQNSDCD